MVLVERAQIQAALPGYEIGEVLGRGSSGLVLAGRHRHISRLAAVKVLTVSEHADRAGFRREADVLAGLDHPHIVRIYDYVERDEFSLLVMESLPGGTLAARLPAARPVPGSESETASGSASPDPALACALVLAAADALAAAHRGDVLHRDVKPTNMMFAADGALKLVDFGISKFLRAPGASVTTIAGTPGYMAPEQLGGGRIGPGTDLYALGVVLYRLLVGRPPFDPSLPPLHLWRLQLTTPAELPAEVAPELAAFLHRALEPSLEDRFAHARDFAAALVGVARALFGPDWLERSGAVVRVDRAILDAARGQGPVTSAAATGFPSPPDAASSPDAATPLGNLEPTAPTWLPEAAQKPGGTTRRIGPPPAPRPPAENTPTPASRGSRPPEPVTAVTVVLPEHEDAPVTPAPPPSPEPVLVVELGGSARAPSPRAARRPAGLVLVAVLAAAAVAGALWTLVPRTGGAAAVLDATASLPAGGAASSAADIPRVVQLHEQRLEGGTGARAEDVATSPAGIRVVVGRRSADGATGTGTGTGTGGGTGGGTEPAAWRSVGGGPWVPAAPPAGAGGGMTAVTFLPGSGFVAVGSAPAPGAAQAAAVWSSADGARWEAVSATWSASVGGPVGELSEVVVSGGRLLAVGRGAGSLETERLWRSADGGVSWEELAVTGLGGPGEQHVTRVVELADGRLLGAGAQPEAGTSVTRLRWSDDGADWRPATSERPAASGQPATSAPSAAFELPGGALVRGLGVLADGRVLAVGGLGSGEGRHVPLIAVGDAIADAVRWEHYTTDPGVASGAPELLSGADAGSDELLVVGDVSDGSADARRAAVWRVDLPERPASPGN
ncbi:serine/threonine protein kinase [Frankia sp. EI5c]|uniref:protein kinase domain-containing protein n=1 Tax=Frankia sp. EI5c TaxID=683316 RepID=UPI0007C4033A|nr:protein kinase [Frankia sp. EI5c]OAA25217.1 serine/threonine protein kinase [Frankia sp. EI5c]